MDHFCDRTLLLCRFSSNRSEKLSVSSSPWNRIVWQFWLDCAFKLHFSPFDKLTRQIFSNQSTFKNTSVSGSEPQSRHRGRGECCHHSVITRSRANFARKGCLTREGLASTTSWCGRLDSQAASLASRFAQDCSFLAVLGSRKPRSPSAGISSRNLQRSG